MISQMLQRHIPLVVATEVGSEIRGKGDELLHDRIQIIYFKLSRFYIAFEFMAAENEVQWNRCIGEGDQADRPCDGPLGCPCFHDGIGGHDNADSFK